MVSHHPPNLAKYIVFSITPYRFALPVEQVLRVIRRPASSGQPNETGLLQIDRYVIKLLDLHESLQASATDSLQNRSILVIIHNFQGHLYGIPICTPPDLVELSAALVHSLPEPNSHSSMPERISYAVATLRSTTVPIFLLDLQRVLTMEIPKPRLLMSSTPSTAQVGEVDGGESGVGSR
jgi:purine-binding chemotaxis protein CheW